MGNPAKRKGTAYESLIVGYLTEHHNAGARRNVQMGRNDIGDIDGYYLHAIEAKAVREITLADFVKQANREAVNAGKPYGCVWIKARGKGVAASYVVRDAETDVRLMNRLKGMETALQAVNRGAWEKADEECR